MKLVCLNLFMHLEKILSHPEHVSKSLLCAHKLLYNCKDRIELCICFAPTRGQMISSSHVK